MGGSGSMLFEEQKRISHTELLFCILSEESMLISNDLIWIAMIAINFGCCLSQNLSLNS